MYTSSLTIDFFYGRDVGVVFEIQRKLLFLMKMVKPMRNKVKAISIVCKCLLYLLRKAN